MHINTIKNCFCIYVHFTLIVNYRLSTKGKKKEKKKLEKETNKRGYHESVAIMRSLLSYIYKDIHIYIIYIFTN